MGRTPLEIVTEIVNQEQEISETCIICEKTSMFIGISKYGRKTVVCNNCYSVFYGKRKNQK